MRSAERNTMVFLPWLLLALGGTLLCIFAPWQQVHPSNVALVHSLGRAPLWTHTYDGLTGARVDPFEMLVEATLILVVCGLLLVVFRSVQSRNIQ